MLLLYPYTTPKNETQNLLIALLNGNIVRVKVLEDNHSRYELSDVLDSEPIILPLTVNKTDKYVSLTPETSLESYKVVVTVGPPFSVEFYLNNRLEVILNGERLTIEKDSQAFSFEVEFKDASKLYGLHHHAYKLALGETADGSMDPFRLRNSDVANYEVNSPMGLYGSVPAIYGHSINWTSGIFVHNAAEQWVDINYNKSSPSAYFMVESGTFDLFVLLGPNPKEVVRQFTNLTGVAHLPQDVKNVIAEMDNHDFPMDAIWLDIDYTDGKRYFTWNPENFSDPVELQKNISSTKRKLVTILDPHIKVDQNYSVYVGAKNKYFVKWANGSDFEGVRENEEEFVGQVFSSYLDFLNPTVRDYYASWYDYDKFNGSTETLAGVWNDMNEPSVFDDSSEKTLPFETLHYNNVPHRDIHNIYGFLQTKATHQGLLQRDNGTKRPFILTRSHFAGSQRYAAMWTGDNTADWSYLAISYSECMLSNILGLVFCGADVGGFFNNPDHELLQRWYQVGFALCRQQFGYLFYRGHATEGSPRREPYLFPDDVQSVIRNAIKLRYKHIPVFYTLFYEHTRNGDPIVRPLFYEYPDYLDYEEYILVGSDILARPVLEANVSRLTTYFPGNGTNFWYRVDNDSWVIHPGGSAENLAVDINTTPFFYRGGSIISRSNMERPSTGHMVNDPYTLYINLDANNKAQGRLYIDDYTSFAYSTSASYLYLEFDYIADSHGIRIREIDGDSADLNAFIQEVVIHGNDDFNKDTTRFLKTNHGEALSTINIAERLRKSGSFTLFL
ncbi:hypothetical protein NQ317_009478 [Molorchus minor]|uniref:Glucosidase II subunit alpha n=1 Tax=Molorchus minor TaxID=1323400 RepID=A0ABQ9JJY8_9CUCU|nr:hypothetical protein NQ317_009478 [Molorchus minor]